MLASGIALIVFTVVVGARQSGLLQPAELYMYDLSMRLRPQPSVQQSPVVLVRITEQDLNDYGYPIPDTVLADALDKLSAAEPRAIGVDLYRDLPDTGRSKLEAAVKSNPRIVLIHKFLPQQIPPPDFLADQGSSAQTGFADLKLDANGVIRRALLILWDPDDTARSYLSFPLMLALHYLRDEGITLQQNPADESGISLGETVLAKFGGSDGAYVRADDGGYQILLDYPRGAAHFESVTAGQLLRGELAAAQIHNKVVIIGTAAPSVQDQYETPFSAQWGAGEAPMYGIQIHAQVLDQLLRSARGEHQPMSVIDEPWELAWILLFATAGAFAGLRPMRTVTFGVAATGGSALPLAIAYGAFTGGWWIPALPPLLAWLVTLASSVAWVAQRQRVERVRIMALFGKFVSPGIAAELWRRQSEFMDGGRPRPQRLMVTVLISDLKGYTAAAESMNASDVMDWINRYISAMTAIVQRHGGIIEDFAGDGLKINFGVPLARNADEVRSDAVSAIECALAMGDALEQINAEWSADGFPTARLRVGVCTGTVTAGAVGGAERMSYKTVGDTVNVAERLESFDKPGFAAADGESFRILISESTRREIGERHPTACIGTHRLRGREGEVTIYRVINQTAEQSQAACGGA